MGHNQVYHYYTIAALIVAVLSSFRNARGTWTNGRKASTWVSIRDSIIGFTPWLILCISELCLQNLNLLEANSLVKMDDGFVLQPTGMNMSHTHARTHTHTHTHTWRTYPNVPLGECANIKPCIIIRIFATIETGRLMARYCVAFESMKRFLGLKGSESLAELVSELSLCQEFTDVRLRVNEKRVLNGLNRDKNKPSIR